jgi:hypothetical protein
MKKPRSSVSLTTFNDVFEVSFWIVLLCVLLILALGFYLIGQVLSVTIGLDSSLATVLLALIGQSGPIERTNMSVRTLVLTTCLTGAMVLWGFNAGIVSVLTVENNIFPIKSLQVEKATHKSHSILACK